MCTAPTDDDDDDIYVSKHVSYSINNFILFISNFLFLKSFLVEELFSHKHSIYIQIDMAWLSTYVTLKGIF